jgi:hypothetical protein
VIIIPRYAPRLPRELVKCDGGQSFASGTCSRRPSGGFKAQTILASSSAGSVINPKDIRAPELGAFDILADVTPQAKARGMWVYLLFEEVYNPRLIPNFEQIAEVDVYGRSGRSTCLNSPHARNFIVSMVEDWFKSNELDGLMWESERQGPLNNMLGANFSGVGERTTANCFCTWCARKGKDQGIDVARAKEGYIALEQWVKHTLHEPRTAGSDGAFVTFWRLLVQ